MGPGQDEVIIQQDVEIERPGRILRRAHPAAGKLDGKQRIEQGMGLEPGLDQDNRIDVIRLGDGGYRGAAVEA